MSELIDMCRKIKNNTLKFVLNPDNVWDSFDSTYLSTVQGHWHEVKFLNDTCDGFNSDIENVPSNEGGIYVFTIKSDIIRNAHIYILYIGRVWSTPDQNLKKRFKEYYNDTRPKIMFMRETWGNNLYIKYLPLTDNVLISNLEEELIKAIIPPCNDKYPKVIRRAMRAAFA